MAIWSYDKKRDEWMVSEWFRTDGEKAKMNAQMELKVIKKSGEFTMEFVKLIKKTEETRTNKNGIKQTKWIGYVVKPAALYGSGKRGDTEAY